MKFPTEKNHDYSRLLHGGPDGDLSVYRRHCEASSLTNLPFGKRVWVIYDPATQNPDRDISIFNIMRLSNDAVQVCCYWRRWRSLWGGVHDLRSLVEEAHRQIEEMADWIDLTYLQAVQDDGDEISFYYEREIVGCATIGDVIHEVDTVTSLVLRSVNTSMQPVHGNFLNRLN